MNQHHHIIIVGAGLSGLYAAWQLQQKQQDVIVLESRERIGGRILSTNYNQSCSFDMGPAWVWPQLQPRVKQLLTDLELNLFQQYTSGDMLYQKSSTELERYSTESSHSQSYRIEGGNQRLVEQLHSKLIDSCVHVNTQVQSIQQEGLSIEAIHNDKTCHYTADKIILALPPRLALQNINFDPSLPDEISQALNKLPTWMAVHSKIIFIYEKPFWREQKLSGEVFSHAGPLSEIYDGSPVTEEYYALTAFVGWNAQQRQQINEEQLIDLCMAQLHKLFGEESKQILDIQIKDWSQDKNTSAEIDLTSPMQHPQYTAEMPRSVWDGQLILAGTEVARDHGGYLEGAIESADEAVSLCVNGVRG